jgi:DNA-binding NarL/FixJ family response regulator
MQFGQVRATDGFSAVMVPANTIKYIADESGRAGSGNRIMVASGANNAGRFSREEGGAMLHSCLEAAGKSGSDPSAARKAKAVEKHERGEQKRCAVFDARPLRGESLACWLRATNAKCVVSTFRKIDALFDDVGSDKQVDLIVFSVDESDLPQVLDALDKLASMSLSIPAVVISSKDDPGAALEFLRRGARGFIPTSLDMMDAAAALDFIAAGGTFLPALLFLEAEAAIAPRRPANAINVVSLGKGENGDGCGRLALPYSPAPRETAELTSREAKVLQCLCRGRPNKLIAHELALCESTVKMYVGRLMRKLKATNRTEVALFGERLLRELTESKPARTENVDEVVYAVQPLRLAEPAPRQQICQSTAAD